MDLRDASASKNKMQKGVKYKCNLKHHFPGLDPDALGVWFHSLLRGSDREGFLHHCAFLHHSNAGVTLEHPQIGTLDHSNSGVTSAQKNQICTP